MRMPGNLTPSTAAAMLALAVCAATSPGAEENSRAPVPDKAELAAAGRAIRELFEARFARRERKDRIALAKTLLSSAEKEGGGTVSRFALLSEAIEVAVDAAEVKTALAATSRLVEEYRVGRTDGLDQDELRSMLSSRKFSRLLLTLREMFLRNGV